ncbi:hypothetical protein D9M70_588340 [compost metagenome]
MQGLVQFFGGAVGVVFDADPAAFLEFVQHLRGDVVVPVVDADQVFGMAEQRSESEEQQGGQAWHWHFPYMARHSMRQRVSGLARIACGMGTLWGSVPGQMETRANPHRTNAPALSVDSDSPR